jgi:hypothetical protein
MGKINWKFRFMGWLAYDICKIPQGQCLPKYLVVVHVILCPVEFILSRQKILRYEFSSMSLWIDGVRYDRRMFKQMAIPGKKLEIISVEDGLITVKEIL